MVAKAMHVAPYGANGGKFSTFKWRVQVAKFVTGMWHHMVVNIGSGTTDTETYKI